MKTQYDFSQGIRGKFFNQDAHMSVLIYLEDENLAFVAAVAERKNSDISTIVNGLISSDRNIADILK